MTNCYSRNKTSESLASFLLPGTRSRCTSCCCCCCCCCYYYYYSTAVWKVRGLTLL